MVLALKLKIVFYKKSGLIIRSAAKVVHDDPEHRSLCRKNVNRKERFFGFQSSLSSSVASLAPAFCVDDHICLTLQEASRRNLFLLRPAFHILFLPVL